MTKDFIVIITLLKQSIELIEVNKTVKNVEHAKGRRQQLPFHANVSLVLRCDIKQRHPEGKLIKKH